ncbi:MAG: adenylosuccinate synthetase, partial [Chitinophagaceae bacterium]
FACMINGVTSIVMTKADVLDVFDELSVCTSYLIDGEPVNKVPYQLSKGTIEPQYHTFEGWKQETSAIRVAAELPPTMHQYVQFINKFLGVPVKYISNGPGRDQIVKLDS